MSEITNETDWYEKFSSKMVLANIRMAWFSLAKLTNEIASQYDGTNAMAFFLMAIDDEGIPVTKIAPRIGMEPNSLSRMIKTLEKNKIIIRKPDKFDQRKVNVHLTEYGLKLRDFALNSVFMLERYLVEELPKEKLDIFFEVMTHVPDAIQRFKEQNLELPKKIDRLDGVRKKRK